ncbi:hypothetical protein LNQ03_03450 [Klebsiella pneumoniae subsp. pneumoniae]|nr:hypothetical protein [Klebsiella pneumoniae subsp. pneumoniae]
MLGPTKRGRAWNTGDDGLPLPASSPAGRDPWPSRDKEGVSVGEALAQIGHIERRADPGVTIPYGACHFEAHISSRGRFSKMKRKTIGIVQGVLGIRWYATCVVTGQASHAGPTTSMRLRQYARASGATRTHCVGVVAIAGRS